MNTRGRTYVWRYVTHKVQDQLFQRQRTNSSEQTSYLEIGRASLIYFVSQPGVYATPFPYWHAMGMSKDTSEEVLVRTAIMHVENLFKQQTAPEDTAAIFIEPVIGEG